MKEAMLNVPSSHGCYFPDTDFIGFEGCSDWPRVMVWDAARAEEQPERIIERMIEDNVRLMLVDTDPANTPAINFFNRKGFGNAREHVFLSLNLAKHEYYGRLINYERDKADRNRPRSRRRT